MNTSPVRLFFALAGLLVGLGASAAVPQTEAVVLKVTGSVKATLADGTTQTLRRGDTLPQGATIVTAGGAEVEVQPFPGTVSIIRENSSVNIEKLSMATNSDGVVTRQTAVLNLTSGNIVSTLDPNKKNINDYSVRTPKGVAAARGTVYTVSVDVQGTSVGTLTGTVTMTPTDGGAPIVIDIGHGTVITGTGANARSVSLADAVKANPAMATAISSAVQSVSSLVQTNSLNASADTSVAVLAAVVKVASQAIPDSASTFTKQAVTALTSTTSPTTSDASKVAAVSAVAEAASQGAVQGSHDANTTNTVQASADAQTRVNAIVQEAVAALPTSTTTATPNIAQNIVNAAATGAANGTTASGVTAPPPTVTNLPTGTVAPTVTPPSTTVQSPQAPVIFPTQSTNQDKPSQTQ